MTGYSDGHEEREEEHADGGEVLAHHDARDGEGAGDEQLVRLLARLLGQQAHGEDRHEEQEDEGE